MDYGSNLGKAAIFDLDGTLLDSMGIWQEIDHRFFARRHIDIPADYAAQVACMQTEAVAEYTIQRFKLQETPASIIDEWNNDAQLLYETVVKPKKFAIEYLNYLHKSGAKLAVATSLSPKLRNSALKHAGMANLFDFVCSLDDAHSVGKEKPDIYLHAAKQLNIAPSACTVFEDILVAIRSAHKAGMIAWGMYDDSSSADWATIQTEADGAIYDFSQAPQIL